MTKADLVEMVATELGLTRVDCTDVINCFLDKIKTNLNRGHIVDMRGFGRFMTSIRKAHTARNPKTNEPVEVPDRTIISFKASANFKRMLQNAPEL